jgi:hypothetical protein
MTKNIIGQDTTSRKTSGLSVKDRKDFERFIKERSQKRTGEEQEEKITGKMPDNEGDASANDIANQNEELAKERHAFKNHPIEDIENE